MIVLIVFCLIAAVFFQREATRRGYDGRKAARYPLIVGAIAVPLAWLVGAAMKLIFPRVGLAPDQTNTLVWIANLFFLLGALATIAKSWKAIKGLPFRTTEGGRGETTEGR